MTGGSHQQADDILATPRSASVRISRTISARSRVPLPRGYSRSKPLADFTQNGTWYRCVFSWCE